jgi:hypothetical protein
MVFVAGWRKCTGPGAACRTTGNRCVILKTNCYVCGRLAEMYRTWSSLQDHRKPLCHLKTNYYVCGRLAEMYRTWSSLQDHRKPLCRQCGRVDYKG